MHKLPCKALLAQREIIPLSSPYCDLSSSALEDGNHILLQCAYAQDYWCQLSNIYSMDLVPNSLTTFIDILSDTGSNKRKQALLAIGAWLL